jgi:hypothetical protein
MRRAKSAVPSFGVSRGEQQLYRPALSRTGTAFSVKWRSVVSVCYTECCTAFPSINRRVEKHASFFQMRWEPAWHCSVAQRFALLNASTESTATQ